MPPFLLTDSRKEKPSDLGVAQSVKVELSSPTSQQTQGVSSTKLRGSNVYSVTSINPSDFLTGVNQHTAEGMPSKVATSGPSFKKAKKFCKL